MGLIGKSKPAGVANSQDFTFLWMGKTAGQKGECPKCPKCDCDIVLVPNCGPMCLLVTYRSFEQFGDKSGNRRALASGQGDVGKELMTLQGFNDGDHAIVATDPKVVPLGHIVGQDDPRCLADSRQDRQ
jgi:hypothetical protein